MISLYRKGNTHIIRDVVCEMGRFKPDELDAMKAQGWLTSPTMINESPTFDQADKNDTGKLSNKEVREAAKRAGLDGWDKRRISALKQELGFDV